MEDGFGLLQRDGAEIHLWAAGDEEWHTRADFVEKPVCSGAESFIAGTASCRIQVSEVDALFDELRVADVLHPTSTSGPVDTEWGTREFHVLDGDGNLLTFYANESSASRKRR